MTDASAASAADGIKARSPEVSTAESKRVIPFGADLLAAEPLSDATRAHTSLSAGVPFFGKFACLLVCGEGGSDTPPPGGVVTRGQFSPPQHRPPSTQPWSFSVFASTRLMLAEYLLPLLEL